MKKLIIIAILFIGATFSIPSLADSLVKYTLIKGETGIKYIMQSSVSSLKAECKSVGVAYNSIIDLTLVGEHNYTARGRITEHDSSTVLQTLGAKNPPGSDYPYKYTLFFRWSIIGPADAKPTTPNPIYIDCLYKSL